MRRFLLVAIVASLAISACRAANEIKASADRLAAAGDTLSASLKKSTENLATATENLDPLATKLLVTQLLMQISRGDSLGRALERAIAAADSLGPEDRMYYRVFLRSERHTCIVRIGRDTLVVASGNEPREVKLGTERFRAMSLPENSLAEVVAECQDRSEDPSATWVVWYSIYQVSNRGETTKVIDVRPPSDDGAISFPIVRIHIPPYVTINELRQMEAWTKSP